MGAISCNGADVLSLRLMLPRSGAWVADVIAAGEETVAACTLKDNGLEWVGTAFRSGASGGRSRSRVVGAIGLLKTLTAKSYVGASVRLVLGELLAAAGETLDTESTASVLSRSLPYWTRPGDNGGTGLSDLAARMGAVWRVRPNGKVWFGVDTFPKQTFDHQELDQNEADGSTVIASDRLELRPGVTFDGRKVGRVLHVVEGLSARTTYWTEP